MDAFWKAVADALPLLLAGGFAALLTALAAIVAACVAVWKLQDDKQKLRADAGKASAEATLARSTASKMDAETEVSLESRIDSLWKRLETMQAENFEFKSQMTLRNIEIRDLNTEIGKLKAVNVEQRRDMESVLARLAECEKDREEVQRSLQKLQPPQKLRVVGEVTTDPGNGKE